VACGAGALARDSKRARGDSRPRLSSRAHSTGVCKTSQIAEVQNSGRRYFRAVLVDGIWRTCRSVGSLDR